MSNLRRRLAGTLGALLGVVLVAGCGGAGTTGTDAPEGQSASSGGRVVTDVYGRQVEIPATVDSAVVDGWPTRLVVYAGAADRLVAVAEIDQGAPVNMPYGYVHSDQFGALPVTASGGSNDVTYDETIIELRPDVVITTKTEIAAIDELQNKLGIPVIGVYQDEVFGGSTYFSLRLLGEVFGTQDRAEEVIAQLDAWQEDLAARTAAVSDDERPTAYTGAVNFRGKHGFDGTTSDYMPFDAIGAINVADTVGQDMPFLVDLEQVAQWDPDYIFLNPENMDLINTAYQDNPDYFDSLRALRDGLAYPQPTYNYNGTNIEIAVADAYYAGTVMFPQEFADIDPDTTADEIFEFFYSTPLMTEMNATGLGFNPLTIGK
ncbi:MAG TPA: ABC transporter substrate-binding protein [Actinomycetaceae bacterium]|nr:ABC transporter substrate-binding protein [Actinomycetaceae bacterium]